MSTADAERHATDLDHDDAAALLECQTNVLALMSTNATRQTLLDEITGDFEKLVAFSHASVLLLTSDGTLRHASAPTIPASYIEAMDGNFPGDDVVTRVATAAHLTGEVIAADIVHDERWTGYQEIAAAAGFGACWSRPVFGRSGRVLGTFVAYSSNARSPTARERRILERLTYLVSAAVEHAAAIGELTASDERYRRAFEDNATAMALLDGRGVFGHVNTTMRTLAGDRLVLGTTTLGDLVVPADAADVAALLDDVRTGRIRQAHGEARVSDGWSERQVSLTMSLVRAADGEADQVSVTMLDLTERNAAKRERRARMDAEVAQRSAEAASHAKSAFLAAVSHEMRTPLQAITGFAELLSTLDLDADRRAEALRHITAGSAHLLELVEETLDLSRIEANALPLAMQPVPTDALVTDVLDFLAPVAEQHGVRIDVGVCDGVALADVRRLRQVLINLVSNGIRYSGPAGRVTVGATTENGTVRITVADNGPGIPDELRAKLFEPFVHRTGDPSVAPARGAGLQGVGLGLMLADGITKCAGWSADPRRPADRHRHRRDRRAPRCLSAARVRR